MRWNSSAEIRYMLSDPFPNFDSAEEEDEHCRREEEEEIGHG